MAKKKVIDADAALDAIIADEVSHAKIHPIAVDFGSEQLNNLARKLNEVIDDING